MPQLKEMITFKYTGRFKDKLGVKFWEIPALVLISEIIKIKLLK